MPFRGANARPQLSVLDRLVEGKPDERPDSRLARSQAIRGVKDAVARDLEWLLNTRCCPEEPDEEMEHLRASVFTYGLPDFTSDTPGSAQSKLLLERALQRALVLFEPRLLHVTVKGLEDESSAGKRIIRFLITGVLRMEPAPEQVSYDAQLELTRGEYRVTGT